MWKKIEAYFAFCGLAFYEKFKLIRRHKVIRYLYILVGFILFVIVSDVLGIPLLDLAKPIFRLLPYQWWIIIWGLLIVTFLMLLMDGARRYHERIVGEMYAERESETAAFLSRAKRIYQLSEVAGRAGEIDLRYSNGEIPEEVLYLWRGLLQTALHNCYGRDGVAKFYRRENETEISPAQGYLWFRSHYARLSDLITEQIQE